MNNQELFQLIDRIAHDTASEEDMIKYNAWCNSFQEKGESIPDFKTIQAGMLQQINRQIDRQAKVVHYPFYRVAAAACILLCLPVAVYFLLHKPQPEQQTVKNQIHDIAPGGNKAVLTLANGKTIILTGARNGTIANQNNTAIKKTSDGQILYDASKSVNTNQAEPDYNTMSTPKAGKYTVVLPDGSTAVLDALSSIRFPTAFNGKTREVTTTGQVYFEVAHNAAKPFRVTTKGQTVEVLGTHFNINAYDDEPSIKTTLLQGSVKVIKNGSQKIITPGQSAVIFENTAAIAVEQANTDEVVAWKNGYFKFNGADIKTLMRQLCRWYDTEVVYEGEVPHNRFVGTISRSKKLSQVLRVLELNNVHLRVEGKKIIVSK